MKTKNLITILSLFLLITLAGAAVVFLIKEKGELVVAEQPAVAEKQAELIIDELAKAITTAPEKNTTPQAPLIRGDEKDSAPVEEKIKAVMIIGGVKYDIAVKPGSSAHDVLNLLKLENKVNFSGKNYAELGFFVEEINGLKNDPAGKNWVYYVNGSPAQVGSSNYLIKNNDIIEWKYEKKSF